MNKKANRRRFFRVWFSDVSDRPQIKQHVPLDDHMSISLSRRWRRTPASIFDNWFYFIDLNR